MRISRRALLASLSALPASALAAGVAPARAAADARAAAPSARSAAAAAADRAVLLENAVAMFAGTPESNSRPEVAEKLAAIEETARERLAALDAAGPGELFAGLELGESDSNLSTAFQYLYEIALATRVPGGPPAGLRADGEARRRVVDGLRWLYEHHYGDQDRGYYGNWFTWEIGISQHVSKILALLPDELAAHDPELTPSYVAAMDAYLRNGEDGDVDLDSRFHTGANLADITTNRVLQGAVLGDDARIAKAVADQLTVYETIDPYRLRHGVTDGFYADGSFIQHDSVAYTGSYGVSLLTRSVQCVKLFDGTGYLPDLPDGGLVDVVRDWLVRGFAPVIFEGWMLEAVRGRAVSRTVSGYDAVAAVVEAVTDLSGHAGGADAAALEGYVRHLHRTSAAPVAPAEFVSPVSVARHADILADADGPAEDLVPATHHAAFHAMDRTVHRRPGYAFALSRSSTRISKYEYMSGENLLSWFQGEGAHHLYLAGQDQAAAHGVDYYTAVPPHRLAGTTVPEEERRTVPELYGELWYDNPEEGFTASSEKQNAYVYFPRATHDHSGGARLGAYGAVGFVQSDDAAYAALRAGELPADFVAYRNAEATKSWFLFDEEIVVLAAGVGDGSGGRPVVTTLDSRIAGPEDDVSVTGELRDGTAFSGTGTAPLAWLRYANASDATALGYVLLDEQRPTVALEEVSRSRRAVRLSNPDTPVHKRVFTLTVDRPAGAPPAALAYALVPHATAERLRGYGDGTVSVLANSVRAQAVAHAGLGLVAVNTFAPGAHRAGWVRVDGPASVLVRERPAGEDGAGTVEVAVADPTTRRSAVAVTLRGRWLRARSADEGVRVTWVPEGTRVRVTTRRGYGRSYTATLG